MGEEREDRDAERQQPGTPERYAPEEPSVGDTEAGPEEGWAENEPDRPPESEEG